MENQEVYKILTINPGAITTKISIYYNEDSIISEEIHHTPEETGIFDKVIDQLDFRYEVLDKLLKKNSIDMTSFDAVVGRGAPLRPMEGGTYRINRKMVDDAANRPMTEHPSLLGPVLAYEIEKKYNVPSYIVDPVCVDEMKAVARITGLPKIMRTALFHALNQRAVAHIYANSIGKKYNDLNLIMVHLGSGISLATHEKGRIVDVSSPNHCGPFSPTRAGELPTEPLVDLCYSSGMTKEKMKKMISREGGLIAHLGTGDCRKIEARVASGDEKSTLILQAMAYNIAKCIGGLATVFKGNLDAVVLTGSLAYFKVLVDWIRERISFLGEVVVMPGEDEMGAMARGALRVLRGKEDVKNYD
ncbi:butyrate kinase [bacterium]|nr:butyrate kinase [bacterium]